MSIWATTTGWVMGLRRAGTTASATVAALAAVAALPADAGAYAKHCEHVRGYNAGTVTVRAMTCQRAAAILWQAREGHFDVSGFHCTARGSTPGGGFPVWVTCKRGRSAARGSEYDGGA